MTPEERARGVLETCDARPCPPDEADEQFVHWVTMAITEACELVREEERNSTFNKCLKIVGQEASSTKEAWNLIRAARATPEAVNS